MSTKTERIHALIEDAFALKEANTQRAYSVAIRELIDFCGGAARLPHVGVEQAIKYVRALKAKIAPDGKPLAPATLRVKLAGISSFYTILVAASLCTVNPWIAASRALPRQQKWQKRPTKLVPDTLIEAIVDFPDQRKKTGVRDAALLALLFGGGLRRSEALSLNVADVEISNSDTTVLTLSHTKAGKRQQRALPDWSAEKFSALVAQRKSDGAKGTDPLFVFYYQDGRVRDGRWDVRTLARTYIRYCRKFELIGFSPHSARATFATKLLDMGYSHRQIADALGHGSTVQVDTYDKRYRGVEASPAKYLRFSKNIIEESS